MNDAAAETLDVIHSRLREISEELTGLSQQNMRAINARDWQLSLRVQKQTAELTNMQTELMRQLQNLQF